MTVKTATTSYWFNWRVLLCALWVLITTAFASYLIWKYEGLGNSRCHGGETKQETPGLMYEDEAWRPSLKRLHPAWLLAFRVLSFFVLLTLIILIGFVDGGSIFYYYTQWTFVLVTVYFGLGSLLSMYGCFQYNNLQNRVVGNRVANNEIDPEQGDCVASGDVELSDTCNGVKSSGFNQGHDDRQPAGFWSYLFQIIFQMNAGAVLLTDCVFWFVLLPFLTIKDYDLSFWTLSMHSLNAVFLLGDTSLNSLRFPWFRIAYFFLWTLTFVVFQWILHASVSLWWPYPFLDLSSAYAPLWYSVLALLHFPCYAIFGLVMKLKHFLLSKWFPLSYQPAR